MYFLEGISYIEKTKEPRLYLSGDNDYLKNFIINYVKDKTGKIPCNYKEIKTNLFYTNKFFPITTDKVLNPKGILIKVSNKKANKKELKENKLEEISCSNLFPSQVKTFIKICSDKYDLVLPDDIADILYTYFKDDLEKIEDYIKIIYYSQLFDNYYIIEDINISTFRLVECVIKGDINSVLRGLYNFKDYFGIIWLLILKYKEVGQFLDDPSKYKTSFMSKYYADLSRGYSKKDITHILIFLSKLLEKIKHNNLANNTVFINGIIRIKHYRKLGDAQWLKY